MRAPDYTLIRCTHLRRAYPATTTGESTSELLFPDIEILANRRIALLGVSGAGKSTFLNLVAGLDTPDPATGRKSSILYTFADGTTADIADNSQPFPRHKLGFVFQEGHLITDASAGINAALPGLLNGIPARDADLRQYMDALELPSDAAGREAWRLSGGQKQRVAILRALFHRPQIVFADEPTSNLDRRTGAAIMRLLVAYQKQVAGRTLFWATHDLALALKFATDLLIVRKNAENKIELEGPLPNPGAAQLSEIEAKVYRGATVPNPNPVVNDGDAPQGGREVAYTQARVGSSLTFAKRGTPDGLAQIGHIGRWMGSIEAFPPPLLRRGAGLVRLYRRFSDHAVAGALGLSVLMLSFVFTGLWTISFVRDQATSDPLACHVVAGAPDATSQGVTNELTSSFVTTMNAQAFWRTPKSWLETWRSDEFAANGDANPCGAAEQLIFGRNIAILDVGIVQDRRCTLIGLSPKILIASLTEPTISSGVRVLSAPTPRRLGELLPQQGNLDLPGMSRPSLTGNELFVTEAFRENLSKTLQSPEFLGQRPAADLSGVSLCVAGRSPSKPFPIGAIVGGLPQPRGIPYDALLGHGAFPQGDNYDQAVFYTHLSRAGLLRTFLSARGFVFSQEEVQRMIASSQRFTAIGVLILVVGGIMIVAAFFFLFTCIAGFMEKNARPNAVLRAYGLTRSMLSRQILWRLAAVLPYAAMVLLFVGLFLGIAFRFVFSFIGLPLPSVLDALGICASAFALTLAGTYVVVLLSVRLWWKKHDRIAQELG